MKSCVRCRHEVRCTHDTASYKSIGISGYRPLAHICIHLSLSFLRMHALSSKSTLGMTHSSLYMTQSSRRHTLLTDYRLSISVCLSIYAQAYLIETGTINPYICIPIDYISIYDMSIYKIYPYMSIGIQINPYICIPIDYISIYEYAYQL